MKKLNTPKRNISWGKILTSKDEILEKGGHLFMMIKIAIMK